MCGSLDPAPLGWEQGAWVTLRNMLLPHTNFGRFIGVSKGPKIFLRTLEPRSLGTGAW